MERKYPNLCKPIRIGNVWYRNRMFSTPMGGTDIELDGCIGPKSQAFYEYRAKGGCAAVTISELMVHPSDGSHAYRLDESILNSLPKATYTADAIRRHGAIPSAAGSSPLRPPIPGLDGENVILVNDQYKHEKPITDSVVVFGGGISGVECAIHMGMEGKTVHLVEMRDDVALDSVIRQRPLLLEKLNKLCTVHTGYKGLEVTKEGIWCQTKEGEKVLVPGTTVICALGQRPRWNVAQELYDCAPWVRVIGDANAVGTITKATYQGHHAALDI